MHSHRKTTMIKTTIFTLMFSASLFGCVTDDSDVEVDVAQLPEYVDPLPKNTGGFHVRPTGDKEEPDAPGTAPSRPEGAHVVGSDKIGQGRALDAPPEDPQVSDTGEATDDVDLATGEVDDQFVGSTGKRTP